MNSSFITSGPDVIYEVLDVVKLLVLKSRVLVIRDKLPRRPNSYQFATKSWSFSLFKVANIPGECEWSSGTWCPNYPRSLIITKRKSTDHCLSTLVKKSSRHDRPGYFFQNFARVYNKSTCAPSKAHNRGYSIGVWYSLFIKSLAHYPSH